MFTSLFINQVPIGDTLVNLGSLKVSQLRKALRIQKKLLSKGYKIPIGKILIKKKFISPEQLYQAYAHQFNLNYLKEIHPDDELILSLQPDFCIHNKIIPLSTTENFIHLATSNPFKIRNLAKISLKFNKPIKISIASKDKIRQVLNNLYQPTPKSVVKWNHHYQFSSDKRRSLGGVHERENLYEAPSLAYLNEQIQNINDEQYIENLVSWLLLKAIYAGASDIHFEPFEGFLRIRHRIDGKLVDFNQCSIEGDIAAAVISRLKVMAKMSLDERQKAQDGRILLMENGDPPQQYDFRVASSPTINGEEIVLRLLDLKKLSLGLEGLGIIGTPLKLIREACKKTSGIIIVTGPTGSGKTTTLYAILQELNDSTKKIMTIEDPVEYRITGLVQHQIREKADFRFPDAIRSFLRHDPDIILVGEIRDKETAEASIWASLTGHLVLTTLHTNDAVSTIVRLMQMGIEPYLISSTVQLILSQRLVRKLCPLCRIKKIYPYKFLQSMGFLHSDPAQTGFDLELFSSYHQAPSYSNNYICKKCNSNGFIDRTAIIEALKISEKIKECIHYDLPASEIKQIALQEGMITIKDDALTKAFHGITSIEEIINATLT